MKRLRLIFVSLLMGFFVSSSNAFMEFYGTNAISYSSQWPKGLNELVNCDVRVAGSLGPIVECQTYYVGTTERLNAFLKGYAGIPDTRLQVVLHPGRNQLNMEKYDESKRTVDVDWSLSYSEYIPNSSDTARFQGKKNWSRLEIWLGGQIDLKILDVPISLELDSSGEIEGFIQKHTAKQKLQNTGK